MWLLRSVDGPLLPRPVRRTQLALEQLARFCARQACQKFHAFRAFEVSYLLAHKVDQLVFAERGARAQHDAGLDADAEEPVSVEGVAQSTAGGRSQVAAVFAARD